MAGWIYCEVFHWHDVAYREWRLIRYEAPFGSESLAAQ
jgi:hypothetical protein